MSVTSSGAIRKFERFLMGCKSDKPIDKTNLKVVGTYFYDFEKGTEKYIPNRKNNAMNKVLEQFTEKKLKECGVDLSSYDDCIVVKNNSKAVQICNVLFTKSGVVSSNPAVSVTGDCLFDKGDRITFQKVLSQNPVHIPAAIFDYDENKNNKHTITISNELKSASSGYANMSGTITIKDVAQPAISFVLMPKAEMCLFINKNGECLQTQTQGNG